MTTKIQKWGNSLAIRIPKSFAVAVKIKEGSDVNLKIEENKLVIYKKKNRNLKLEEFLSKVSDKNIHKEFSYGKPRGKELL
ncbi:MAG TPA: AbrB/MazE/SpoVT family DNA-binding domain-containing protein [Ignavibacteria bacterium]|jgi:antitoxin MazE